MKRILAVLTLVVSTSAFTAPLLINDNYVGADDHNGTGFTDVIGDVSKFGIDSMLVNLVGNQLTVTINTLFGANGLGTFVSATSNANVVAGRNKGIGYGDLFLSSSGWNPAGTAPYDGDDHSNGTVWDFGITLSDRWSTASSIGATLYALGGTNNQNAYLTEDFLSSATFRNGQETAVDITSSTVSALVNNSATFAASATSLTFTLDITGTALQTASNIGLHWNMTCGNDTIEGGYNVPEPATILVMLLGLVCLSVAGLRRRKVVIADNADE